MRKNFTAAIAGMAVLGAVLAQPNQLTPEEQRLLLQLLLKQQGIGNAVSSQAQTTPPAPLQVSSAGRQMTEAELQASLDKWPTPPQGVNFTRYRDGFSIDGVRQIDPEGQIAAYGFDALTGDYTYLSQTQAGAYIIKSGRAHSGTDPVSIASAEKRGALWNVTTVTGKRLSGQRLMPSSRGFVIARDNTGFRYTPGKNVTNFAAPEEFLIAALQNGDIAHTGQILLERNPAADTNAKMGAAGQLLNSFKSFGSALGINRKEDYALMNIDTGKLTPINISMEGKQVLQMSECRKRNSFVNDCARADSFESAYKPDGQRNMSHYFWRIHWFSTTSNPVLISQEGGLGTIMATDLNSGKKVALFERALGIASFEVQQRSDGTLDISAQMGFNTESKKDIASLIDALPSIEVNK